MKHARCLSGVLLVWALIAFALTGCGSSSSSGSGGTTVALTPSSTEYPNAILLVSQDSVQQAVTAQDVKAQKTVSKNNLVIIDARTSGYESAHIPGAVNLKFGEFFTGGVGLLPVTTLESNLSAKGLKRDFTYIIYDNTSTSFGAAGRIFWMLEYLGCNDVHILDGGWDKWVADGRPTESTLNTLPANNFIAKTKSEIRATKDHIKSRLNSSDFAIVDARADEEYIGWQRYGETRGGHIPGAVQIPYEWYFKSDKTVLRYADLKAMFESHGVTQDKEVTAYCTVGIRSGYVYFLLRLMGYPNASNYDGSIAEWSADSSLPMEKMANYKALVYAQWVKDLIDGKNPPTYPGNGYVILYTTWTARYEENRTDYVGTNYETGHIPGAMFLDTYSIENGPNSEYGEGYQHPSEGNVKPIPQLQQFLGSMGISKDKTVVVYADDEIAMMTAGRVAWALLLAGVDDVRILNGGYSAWVRNGGPVETTPHAWSPVAFGSDPGNPQYLATMDNVKNVINGTISNTVITDDRSWEEYIGDSNSYYPYFFALGRIPTAKWIGDWVELARSDFQTLRTYTEVEAHWRNAGFTPDKKMYFYCGTGWRSGLYTFYAYLLGWPAANYDGGWFEWTYYPDNPKETGTP
jgi:3-mercaptopyruvate sulfurtransferase SseA